MKQKLLMSAYELIIIFECKCLPYSYWDLQPGGIAASLHDLCIGYTQDTTYFQYYAAGFGLIIAIINFVLYLIVYFTYKYIKYKNVTEEGVAAMILLFAA